MAGNRAVVYTAPYTVQVQDIDYPKMEAKGKAISHGVILQILATNICGSDLHMYRGRTDLQPGTPVGHEITGMVIEKGSDVETLEIGDIVSVPFNISCGRCRNCKELDTQFCLSTNDLKPGGAYGYAEMGPWQGGQAEYVLVPYADFNLLKFPDREQAMERLLDLAMLSDIFPTGFHGAVTAGVEVGSTVYIAGAGPVGLCAAVSCYLLGAACVIVGDYNQERLDHAASTLGCETINIAEHEVITDQIAQVLKTPLVDCAIDAIGYEAHGHGHKANREVPSDALDTSVDVLRYGGTLGVPGVYMPIDSKGKTLHAKIGRPAFEFGRAWDKGLTISTGQVPVMRYNRKLMTSILFERVKLSRILNTTVISLDEAPEAYRQFEQGIAQKFVLNPHGVLKQPTVGADARVAIGV
ncbi:MAG: glutathione-independent formaldehyde dehydrogenase [Vampirovibrio sp.]|jgi:glutathione-independent formaldehyde dehydrogenase|nr:glutathione-independent formaldehyde dehydrogenase [Vampirovibrio sp.]